MVSPMAPSDTATAAPRLDLSERLTVRVDLGTFVQVHEVATATGRTPSQLLRAGLEVALASAAPAAPPSP